MKTPKSVFYIPSKGAAPEELETDKFLKMLAKEHDMKADDYFQGLVKVALDPDGFDLDEEGKTPAEIKAEKKVIAAITKAFNDSEKLVAKAKADEEKAEAAKEQEGKAIILAAHEGSKLSVGVVGNTVNWLQEAVGDKFVVSQTGLKVAKGATPSTEDMARIISGLSQTDGNMDAAKMTVMWSLGDALALAKKTLGDEDAYDRLVENAVSEFGKAKHTIQQAVRVAEFFPTSHRDVPGWTYTHFQECMNYAEGFKDINDLYGLMAKLSKGKDATITVDKKKLSASVPLSCAELRAELQEKTGKAKPSGSNGGTKPTYPKYIYVSCVDGKIEAVSSDDCSMEACASGEFTVIDVKLNALIDKDGNCGRHLKPLPKRFFMADAKPKKEDDGIELPE